MTNLNKKENEIPFPTQKYMVDATPVLIEDKSVEDESEEQETELSAERPYFSVVVDPKNKMVIEFAVSSEPPEETDESQ